MTLHKILVLLFVASCPIAFAGENKDSQDAVFNQPQTAGWTQVLLGLVDYGGERGLKQVRPQEVKNLEAAERELKRIDEAPLTWQEKSRADILYDQQRASGTEADEIRSMNRSKDQIRLDRIKMNRTVRAADFRRATESLQDARAAALVANQRFGNRAIKGAALVGRVIFLTDLAGRIYVWNALDASPTLTPVGTATWHKAQNALHLNEPSKARSARSAVQSNQPSEPAATSAQ